jgi:hypothetical protein
LNWGFFGLIKGYTFYFFKEDEKILDETISEIKSSKVEKMITKRFIMKHLLLNSFQKPSRFDIRGD